MRTLSALFIAALGIAAPCLHAQTAELAPVPATLRVDESKVVNQVRPEILGMNYDWDWSQREFVVAPDSSQVSESLMQACRGLPLPLNRMAGSESQYLVWENAIGSLADRKPQHISPWSRHKLRAQTFGPVEWVNMVQKLDAQARFTWTVNMVTQSPENAANLVSFLTGTAGPWAQKRRELGLENPVPVVLWELGNELDMKRYNMDENAYVERCREFMASMTAVDPSLKFAAHAATGPWDAKWQGTDWRKWHRAVLEGIGDKIDYLVFHPYYDGTSIPQMERYIDVMEDDIKASTHAGRIKLFISEHATWPRNRADGNLNFDDAVSLRGVLSTGTFVVRMLQRPMVARATYHSFASGPWGIVRRDPANNQFYRTGIFALYQLLNSSLGTSVVESTLEGERTDLKNVREPPTLAVGAMQTERGMNLILINRDPDKTRAVSFHARQSYSVLSQTVLTGESLQSLQAPGQDGIVTKETSETAAAPLESIQVPAKSMMVMKLGKIQAQ